MPVVKTARAILDILDAEGKITGHEIEYHYTFSLGEGEDPALARMFSPKVGREEVSPETVAAMRKESDNALTATVQMLNAANAALQGHEAAAIDARAKLAAIENILKQ